MAWLARERGQCDECPANLPQQAAAACSPLFEWASTAVQLVAARHLWQEAGLWSLLGSERGRGGGERRTWAVAMEVGHTEVEQQRRR